MSTLMPTSSPTLTDLSIGRVKKDRDAAADLDTQIPAQEYNQFRAEFIAACDEIIVLRGGGMAGTLQTVYNQGTGPTTYIRLDNTRGPLIVRDATTPLTDVLLGVSDTSNANGYGFTATGLLLPDLTTAIQSAAGASLQMMSGGSKSVVSAYSLDTTDDYDSSHSPHTSWLVQGQPAMAFYPGAAPVLGWYDSTSGALLGGIKADVGLLQLAGSGALNFLPYSAGLGSLGTAAIPWQASYALTHRGKLQTVTFSATPTIDASLGEMAQITLTAAITGVTISNFASGQYLTLKFIQDATGGRTLAGLPAAVKLQSPFTLSTAAAAVDALVLWSDGTNFYEVGRYQQASPEKGVTSRTLAATNVTLTAHTSDHTQIFSGTLSGAVSIDLSNTGAQKGDRIMLIFTEATGVTTDAMGNSLTLSSNGGATVFALYNQAKTLKGEVTAVYTGSAWILPIGGALSYA